MKSRGRSSRRRSERRGRRSERRRSFGMLCMDEATMPTSAGTRMTTTLFLPGHFASWWLASIGAVTLLERSLIILTVTLFTVHAQCLVSSMRQCRSRRLTPRDCIPHINPYRALQPRDLDVGSGPGCEHQAADPSTSHLHDRRHYHCHILASITSTRVRQPSPPELIITTVQAQQYFQRPS